MTAIKYGAHTESSKVQNKSIGGIHGHDEIYAHESY